MHLTYKPSGDLLEILNPDCLLDWLQKVVKDCFLADETLQPPEAFGKDSLEFLSGETLPRCGVKPTNKGKLRASCAPWEASSLEQIASRLGNEQDVCLEKGVTVT